MPMGLLAMLGRVRYPNREEVEELVRRRDEPDQDGDDEARKEARRRSREAARRDLIERNIPLAIREALRMAGQRNLPADDVISIAMPALVRAAGSFNPARGFRFSTYAIRVVRNEINRCADEEATTIRVPQYLHDAIDREYRGKPHPPKLKPIPHLVDRARHAMKAKAYGTTGLGRDADLMAIVPNREPGPTDDFPDGPTGAALEAIIRSLPPHLAEVILARYLCPGEPPTQAALGKRLGLSKSTVSHREIQALGLLRAALTTTTSHDDGPGESINRPAVKDHADA